MKIHPKSWKRKMAAVMACVLTLSVTGVQSVFAAEENVNTEAVISQEEIGEKTAEEIGVEENSAGIDESLGEDVEVNESIAECEVVEPEGFSVELRVGQMVSLPTIIADLGVAIKSNGDLYCWGANECGQVGNGTTTNQSSPVKVLEQVTSVSVSNSNYGSGKASTFIGCTVAAIKSNGDLYCWGYSGPG